MPINTSDHQFGVIKEVTAGTTPATPTFLVFPHASGTELQLSTDSVTSPIVRSSRASDGARKVNYRAEGSMKSQLFRAPVFELLLESALSGAFATNVLKAGNTDTSFTVEKKSTNSGTALYHRYTGCQVSKLAISGSSDSVIDVNFDILGMNRSESTTAIASSVYTQPTQTTLRLAGIDLNTVTIAGLASVAVDNFELSVEHDREALTQMGSTSATGIATGGMRKVTLSMRIYQVDLAPETLMARSDAAIAVSFRIGTTTDGWQFDIPAANFDVPQHEADGAKAFYTVNFTAKYDNTSSTDFIITKLV